MVGHGFTSEVAQNKSMAASFDGSHSQNSPKLRSSHNSSLSSASSNNQQPNNADNPLGKKVKESTSIQEKNLSFHRSILFQTLTLEEKERMMRESEHSQRMKAQGDLVPERRSLASMASSSTTTSGTSSYLAEFEHTVDDDDADTCINHVESVVSFSQRSDQPLARFRSIVVLGNGDISNDAIVDTSIGSNYATSTSSNADATTDEFFVNEQSSGSHVEPPQ